MSFLLYVLKCSMSFHSVLLYSTVHSLAKVATVMFNNCHLSCHFPVPSSAEICVVHFFYHSTAFCAYTVVPIHIYSKSFTFCLANHLFHISRVGSRETWGNAAQRSGLIKDLRGLSGIGQPHKGQRFKKRRKTAAFVLLKYVKGK